MVRDRFPPCRRPTPSGRRQTLLRLAAEPLEHRRVLEAGPIISEFMALNDGTVTDSFGEHSDWVEIHNPTAAVVNLDGWYLTDNASNPTKWRFPAVTLDAGGYLIVFASSRDRRDPTAELHTNFALSGDGEYLGLVGPDGSTVVSGFSPTYPGQFPDVSYGRAAGGVWHVTAGDLAAYTVPTQPLANAPWTAPAFDDTGWSWGPTGIGAETGNGFAVDYYKANGEVRTIEMAEGVVALPVHQARRVTASYPTINFYGTGTRIDHFPGDVAFPDQTMNVNTDDFVIVATTKVFIPAPGVWTFGARSDDGFKLTVFNGKIDVTIEFTGTRAEADTLETVSFAAAGLYSLRFLSFDRGGGSMAELFAAPGTHYEFDPDVFRLVGDHANGGLAVAGFGGAVQTDVSALVVGRNTSLWARIPFTVEADATADTLLLRMKYADGFIAYLNGVEVARANSPAVPSYAAAATAARSLVDSLAWSTVDITPHRHLLVAGRNVLAIHALNDELFDRDFLVLPELIGVSDTIEIGHLSEASPGSPNVAAVVRYVAAVTASRNRGIQGDPFDLVLSTETANAEIRYTLDGSEPTATTGLVYSGPVRIDRTTTLRTAAFLAGWTTRESTTHSYIFLDDVLQQSPAGQPPASPGPNGFNAYFDTSAEGFSYADDLLGTGQPARASGGHSREGGQAGGGLVVNLQSSPAAAAASGGFVKSFTVERSGLYGVWLRYRMVVGAGLAPGRYGDLVLRIDGDRYGADTDQTLIRRVGDGTGSGSMDTGWRTYGFNITLSAGTHTLELVAYVSGAATNSTSWLTGSFDEVIVSSWPAATVNSQVVDYGMDPDIVGSSIWGPQLRAALTAIPTIAISTDIANLYDPALGIYANPQAVGRGWERPVSMELIYPDGSAGFQVEAGMRIRGGFSSSPINPKHAMRFFFRREYGDASLAFPLFGAAGTDEFEKIDLRTSQNYSWSFEGSRENAFVRDVFARDTHAAMGQPSTRSVAYHVYINGQYHGLFETQERADANHAAAYLGGDSDDYDVVKVTHYLNYVIEATDGSLNAWQDLWNQAGGLFTATSYFTTDPVPTLSHAHAVIATPALQARDPVSGSAERINFLATGARGRYDGDAVFPGLVAGGAAPDMVVSVTGTIEIPTAGDWTFGVHSSRGFRLELWNGAHRFSLESEGSGSPRDTLATFPMPAAGSYHLRLVHVPGGSGGGLEVFAARGARGTFDASVFRLVGDRAAGGIARSDMSSQAAYLRVLGRDPDGSANPLLPTLVDVENLIDYIIVVFYTGNTDAPVSNFLANARPNNWYGAFNRVAPDGFRFFVHDSEHTLGASSAAFDRTGPYPAGDIFRYSNPQWIHQQLMANPEYRLRFADRAQAHLVAPGGALTPAVATARYQARMQEIEAAVIAESARWGDAKRATPRTKTDWERATNADLVHLQNRTQDVLNQLKTTKLRNGAPAALFPGLAAPLLGQHGGRVPSGYPLTVTGAGTLYYTLDGTDPRLLAGGVSPAARVYAGSLPITASATVRIRGLQGEQWSPLTTASFEVGVPAAAGLLAITELNYHAFPPTDAEKSAGYADPRDFDFIELKNISAGLIDLTDASFSQGITFSFTGAAAMTLDPGDFVIVARNPAAMAVRYGEGLPVAGGYTGQLDNSGERVTLVDRRGATITSVRYRSDQGWPWRASGFGSSLEIVDATGDPEDAANWRPSVGYGGSPGVAGITAPAVVINEILAHTDFPDNDAIELMNCSTTSIDVSGWYLSDSRTNLFQYQFPSANSGLTEIPAGGYLVIDGPLLGFGFSSLGEEAWLISVDASGRPLAFVNEVSFGATRNGESLGRWPNGTGGLQPMVTPTLGSTNAGPRIGPVVISEVMYSPQPPTFSELAVVPGLLATELEFVEIYNPLPTPVDLTNWQIRSGITFDFPAGTMLPGRGTVVVLPFAPRERGDLWAVFAGRYLDGLAAIPDTFLGPYAGRLDNAGERVDLLSPDTPQPDDPALIPRVFADQLDYQPVAPWPVLPSQADRSLERGAADAWGGDPLSWIAVTPTPGSWDAETFAPVTIGAGDVVVDPVEWRGGTVLVKRGAGRLVLDRGNHHFGGTVVEAGEVVIRNVAALGTGPLQVFPGARVTLDVGVQQVMISNLDLSASGILDLATGSMLLAPGSYVLSDIRSLIMSARGAGIWSGPGITSTTIQPGSFREIGYRVHPDGSLEVGYSAVGDSNMDGSVSVQDLIFLNAGGKYGGAATDAGWWEGDFNYDGRVTIADLVALVSSGLYGGGVYLPVNPAAVVPSSPAQSPWATAAEVSVSPGGDLAGSLLSLSRREPGSGPSPSSFVTTDTRAAELRRVDQFTWAVLADQREPTSPLVRKTSWGRLLVEWKESQAEGTPTSFSIQSAPLRLASERSLRLRSRSPS
jgi:autotransporter-associated beta strand protein